MSLTVYNPSWARFSVMLRNSPGAGVHVHIANVPANGVSGELNHYVPLLVAPSTELSCGSQQSVPGSITKAGARTAMTDPSPSKRTRTG